MEKFDLHMHSNCSDGTFAPSELVYAATKEGVRALALSDHDCMAGVREAQEAGASAGVRVLAGVEFDCAWPHELHMLGLGLDAENAALKAALDEARARRDARNVKILKQLEAAGLSIEAYLHTGGGSVTRLHIALALRDAGYAATTRDAFRDYLREGCVGYVAGFREGCIRPERAIEVIRGAGGLPVWAHPAHVPANIHAMTDALTDRGLGGLEVWHPSASEGDSTVLLSLATQHGLLATCGSDFHGANRPGVLPGCTWRDCAALEKTYTHFFA